MKRLTLFFITLFTTFIVINAQEQLLAYNEIKKADLRLSPSSSSMNKANAANTPTYQWEFLSTTPSSFDDEITKNAGSHEFGSYVACLKKMVEKSYVTKEDVIPGDPMMRTIVNKPQIYYLVRKIEKHFKKEVEKNEISLTDASSQYAYVLKVALALLSESAETTSPFEAHVKNSRKDIETQIDLFQQVKLYNIYGDKN